MILLYSWFFRDDFRDYAEICFKHFGNRVKYWITLNEPWSYTNNGYALGSFPPCRCSKWVDSTCVGGDSGTEPYIASHNLLLAHAAAVHVYKKKFQVFFFAFTKAINSSHFIRIPHYCESSSTLWYNSFAYLTFKTLHAEYSERSHRHNTYFSLVWTIFK